MSTSLNLYATKVFSEQPTALWALDDTTDYVALIDSTNQNLDNWTVEGATVVDANTAPSPFEQPPKAPFSNSYISGIQEEVGNFGNIAFTSPTSFNTEDLNAELGSFAIGLYVFNYDTTVTVHIGYEYEDPESGSVDCTEICRSTLVPVERRWAFVSETFKLPESYNNLKFIIRLIYEESEIPAQFAINGINIGQWAEEFHVESLGVTPEPLPGNINIVSDAIPALPYGLDGSNGYYLSENNVLYAKNSGLPLVYGAFNSTVIFPHTNKPSLIIPGFGFMNESGKYKTFTTEFWAKIQSNATAARRIFGPISSTDGLYVEGPFLKFKVNNIVGSHYVGEWDRPMLLNIRFKTDSASLVVNGEEVISLELDTDSLVFPEKTDSEGNDLDWLGFYAYDDVPIVQLDCVGIYPYEVAALVAKRRFVYGQGVDVPNNIKGLNASSSAFIDHTFSKTAKNYSYPRMGTWRNGVVENLTPQTQELSLPDYVLPTISFNNQSISQWYFDLENAQELIGNRFIKLKPNSSWDDTEGYMLFDSLNLLQDDTKSFYGIFEIEELTADKQILFELVNDLKGARLTISLEKKITVVDATTYEDYVINYTLSYKASNGQTVESLIYYSINHQVDDIFLVGLHIPRFVAYFGQIVNSFFGAKQNIKVFVGGSSSYTNTFKGKIYRVGFSTARNLSKIENLFNGWGVPTDYENPFDFYKNNDPQDGGDPSTDLWELEEDGGTSFDYIFVSSTTDSDPGVGRVKLNNSETTLATYMFIDNQSISPVTAQQFFINDYESPMGGQVRVRNTTDIEDFVTFEISGNVIDANGYFKIPISYLEGPSKVFSNGENVVTVFEPIQTKPEIIPHLASYTLIPKLEFENFKLDIGIDSYWEDYIPLSYFGKYVKDFADRDYFTLDFLQLNIDYPKMSNFSSTNYDTSSSLVKTYITFQYLAEGSNKTQASFTNTVALNRNGIVRPGDEWLYSKYEVLNDTVIYPPAGINFNSISVNIHIEVGIDSILSNPLKIRSLQISSQALGQSPNRIGTRFGTEMYPYKKDGLYFDYKTINPFSLSKTSTPYLYMSGSSGIRMRGNYSPSDSDGITLPINKNLKQFFKVGAFQFAIRYDEELFPEAPAQVFEIEDKNEIIKFYLVAEKATRRRGYIFAINNSTGQLNQSVIYNLDGRSVKKAVLSLNSWSMVGLAFSEPLDMSETVGAFRVTSPLMFDAISFYQVTEEDEAEKFAYRKWYAVRSEPDNPLDWEYWKELDSNREDPSNPGQVLPYNWQEVLFLSEEAVTILDPSKIYKQYVGTDRIVFDNDYVLNLNNYRYSFFKDVRWSRQILDSA